MNINSLAGVYKLNSPDSFIVENIYSKKNVLIFKKILFILQ